MCPRWQRSIVIQAQLATKQDVAHFWRMSAALWRIRSADELLSSK
jgi:hypothetical protein